MCGVGGYFSREGIDPEEGRALLARMAEALQHRGPDDTGMLVTPHCGLVSTRLSIIDVEHGHMPLFNEDEQVAVVFNGEIYNHRALRGSLEPSGHRFRTNADTEVLVHGYEDLGEALPGALTGMFAFALWDANRRRLVLARDRFGIKPLFTADRARGDLLLFASEAKAILATRIVQPKLDPRALLDVMTAGYPMPPATMFAGIRALAPGSTRTLQLDGADHTARYWAIEYPSTRARAARSDPGAAAESLRALLTEVVREHLIADVPVGSYLSGGLDSVAIATLAAAALDRPLQTFSMGFASADAGYDETPIAELVARAIGAEHTRVEITGISAEDYGATIAAMEAPQVHTVAFCLHQLARAVHGAGLKVILTGEGSDEIFAGYAAFRLRRARRALGGVLRPLRDAFLRGLLLLGIGRRGIVSSLVRWSRDESSVAERYRLIPPWIEHWWLLLEESSALLTAEARAALLGSLDPVALLPEPPRALEGEGTPAALLHRELAFEQASRLDGWVLALGDRLTMAHSVEARVPFLDHRIAELTQRVPPRLLLRAFQEKHLLRRALTGVILEAARRRKKRAFMAPITRWLFQPKRPEFVDAALSPSALAKAGLFDPAAVEARLRYLETGAKDLRALRASWALNLVLGTSVLMERFGASL